VEGSFLSPVVFAFDFTLSSSFLKSRIEMARCAFSVGMLGGGLTDFHRAWIDQNRRVRGRGGR